MGVAYSSCIAGKYHVVLFVTWAWPMTPVSLVSVMFCHGLLYLVGVAYGASIAGKCHVLSWVVISCGRGLWRQYRW